MNKTKQPHCAEGGSDRQELEYPSDEKFVPALPLGQWTCCDSSKQQNRRNYDLCLAL